MLDQQDVPVLTVNEMFGRAAKRAADTPMYSITEHGGPVIRNSRVVTIFIWLLDVPGQANTYLTYTTCKDDDNVCCHHLLEAHNTVFLHCDLLNEKMLGRYSGCLSYVSQ